MAINQKKAADKAANPGGGFSKPLKPNEFRPQANKSYILRILPANIDEYEADEADDFAYLFKDHGSYIKSNGEALYDIPCPKMFDPRAECPLCKESWELHNSPHPEDKKIAKDLYNPPRMYLNILDLSDQESVAKGVQWWSAPKKAIYDKIKELLLNPQWVINDKDILDLKEGRNFTIKMIPGKESSTGYAQYSIQPAPNAYDITSFLVGDWRERINSLETKRPSITVKEVTDMLTCEATATTPPQVNVPAMPSSNATTPGLPQAAATTPNLPNNNSVAQELPGNSPTTPNLPGANSITPELPQAAATTPTLPEENTIPPALPTDTPPASPTNNAAQEASVDVENKPECFGKYVPRAENCKKCQKENPSAHKACCEIFMNEGM